METTSRYYLTLILAIALAASSCTKSSKDAQPVKDSAQSNTLTLSEAQYKSVHIRLGQITSKKMVTTLQVNGVLDVPPQNLVTISAPMGGFVKDTKVLQGMQIKKGEVIAVLEHQDYIQLQQDYLDNASKLEYLQVEYLRQEELSKENINSKKNFQLAKSNYESAKAQVEGLRAKLKMLNIDPSAIATNGITSQIKIHAPLSGFVTEVNVNIGSYVNNVDPMFRIVDVNHLHAELQVYEKDIHKVHIGQRVNFHLPGETSARTASVFLVGKEISKDRTVRVHCHLDKEDENLLPGMYVSAAIETLSEDAQAINSSAIVSFDGQKGIFVKRGDRRFELVEVKTGTSAESFTVIEVGPELLPGDSIVVEGTFELLGLLKNMDDE